MNTLAIAPALSETDSIATRLFAVRVTKSIHIIRRTPVPEATWFAKALNALTAQHALATDAERKPARAICGVLVTNLRTARAIQNPAVTAAHPHGTAVLGVLAQNLLAAPARK
jgi:hypothetical protein